MAVKAGDLPQPQTALDLHKARQTTPGLTAFAGRSAQSTAAPTAPTPPDPSVDSRLAGSTGANDPRLGGSAYLDKKTIAKRIHNVREWGSLTMDEKVQRAKDPVGAAAAQAIQDQQAYTPPRWAQDAPRPPLTPARPKAIADRAIQATDKRNLAEHGTIAVDPRHAGPGQLTTDVERKNGRLVNVRKSGTPEPRTARFVQGWGNMVKQS